MDTNQFRFKACEACKTQLILCESCRENSATINNMRASLQSLLPSWRPGEHPVQTEPKDRVLYDGSDGHHSVLDALTAAVEVLGREEHKMTNVLATLPFGALGKLGQGLAMSRRTQFHSNGNLSFWTPYGWLMCVGAYIETGAAVFTMPNVRLGIVKLP